VVRLTTGPVQAASARWNLIGASGDDVPAFVDERRADLPAHLGAPHARSVGVGHRLLVGSRCRERIPKKDVDGSSERRPQGLIRPRVHDEVGLCERRAHRLPMRHIDVLFVALNVLDCPNLEWPRRARGLLTPAIGEVVQPHCFGRMYPEQDESRPVHLSKDLNLLRPSQ
jgi:hypothetical protein